MQLTQLQNQLTTTTFQAGGMQFALWQVLAIVILLFFLVLTMASVRRHFLEWTVKGAGFGVLLGFVLALIIEGFLLVGGRTALTEVLGWKNAPKPVQVAIDQGRERLINVLGTQTEVPLIHATEYSSVDEVVQGFQGLSSADSEKAKEFICTP